MNPQNIKYFAIIVQYGPQKPIKRALKAIISNPQHPDKIVIVDQNSLPLDLDTQNQPITVIRRNKNSGYSAGVNTGLGALVSLGASDNDIVVIMNNDIETSVDTFTGLRKWWQKNYRDAVVGVSVEERGVSLTGSGAVNLFNGRAILHNQDKNSDSSFSHCSLQTIPYIHGAFFSAPYRVFLRLKGLPEKYFMYWEDIDFSLKASKKGIPLKLMPEVKIKHHCLKSDNIKDSRLYYLVRNGAIFLEKETPFIWKKYWWIFNRLRLIYHSLFFYKKPTVRRALFDAVRGKTGKTYT